MKLPVILFAAALITTTAQASTPYAFKSPWDITPIPVTDRPFDCGPPAPIGPDIMVGSVNNSDRQLSNEVKDAVYAESTTALKDLTRRVVEAADNFRATGSRAAAGCVVELLSSAANNGAMTGYLSTEKKLFYQNEALRAFSIAYLKARPAQAGSPQQDQLIVRWMESLVIEEKNYYEHDFCGHITCNYEGHRGLATAAAAFAVGIAANDEFLIHWAEGRYHAGIKQIDGRGMLHYDMKGSYALKNNLESTACLVQMAEFGEINNMPMYAYEGGRIHLLVHTIALGLVDPSLYRTYTHQAQTGIPKGIATWEVSWASVYNRRFPDPILTSLIHQAGPGGNDMWGGEPWDPDANAGI